MEWFIKERIAHGVYEAKKDIPEEVNQLANQYEGAISNRTGWNIPMTFIRQHTTKSSLFYTYWDTADYVIVYPKNDIQTKKHELLHALYAMNPHYRSHVNALWDSLTKKEQDRIYSVLRQLHYPDDPTILLDEFQAYYYTEKPSFFGIRSLRK